MTEKHQSDKDQVDCLIRDIPVGRLLPNRESISLVWYNPTLTEASIDKLQMASLRRLNNYILLYTEKSLCVEYLRSNMKRCEHIILVLYGMEILDIAYECQQVHTILIVDSNITSKLNTNEHHHHHQYRPKTVAVFDESDSMVTKLEETIANVQGEVAQQMDGMFSAFDQKEIALRDLQLALGSSVWCQVFKIMVKAMPRSVEAQQQMLEECRAYYHDNRWELAQIDKFEQNYQPENAIEWYTKPGFLSKTINKALRTEDIVALYTFRYYITDLSTSLEVARCEQVITQVYRGATVSRNELDKYQVGGIVATNGFLSTSLDKKVAEMFCGFDFSNALPTRSLNDELQNILFEIIIDPNHSAELILADISSQSYFKDEGEILFDTGTPFEIVSIHYDDKHHLWHIQMQTSVNAIPIYQKYEIYIRKLMEQTNVNVLFGILLTDMGEYTKASNYFNHLLTRMSNDHEDRANLYYSLSRVHRFQGELKTALTLLQQAQCLQDIKSDKSSSDLARILAGIGSVYYEMRNYEQELHYYQCALTIYQKNLPEDDIEIARSLNRVGFAYLNQKCYDDALHYLTKALTIYRKVVPDNHPSIGQSLLNLGQVQHALGHVDQALDFYQEALKQAEKILPADHLHLALPCYLLSVVYEQQQQCNLALAYAQRALHIREKTLPSEHESLIEVRAMITRLQNKN